MNLIWPLYSAKSVNLLELKWKNRKNYWGYALRFFSSHNMIEEKNVLKHVEGINIHAYGDPWCF